MLRFGSKIRGIADHYRTYFFKTLFQTPFMAIVTDSVGTSGLDLYEFITGPIYDDEYMKTRKSPPTRSYEITLAVRDLRVAIRKQKGHDYSQLLRNARVRLHNFQAVNDLIQPFKLFLARMERTTHKYFGQSWDDIYKDSTFKGYDLRKNEVIDYGNEEYSALLGAFMITDPDIDYLVGRIAEFWNSLDKFNHPETEHAISMQGDLIELFMAACRGSLQEVVCYGTNSIPLFNKLCSVLQSIQFFDGHLRTTWIKHSKTRVTRFHKLGITGTELFTLHWANRQGRAQLIAACSEQVEQ